jgi:hypothetical protein
LPGPMLAHEYASSRPPAYTSSAPRTTSGTNTSASLSSPKCVSISTCVLSVFVSICTFVPRTTSGTNTSASLSSPKCVSISTCVLIHESVIVLVVIYSSCHCTSCLIHASVIVLAATKCTSCRRGLAGKRLSVHSILCFWY